uniref:Uncharacterized protein n=1 Tax=Chenopodium quinoa TaxID=63459 RepID=A0A803MW26_CHEQI
MAKEANKKRKADEETATENGKAGETAEENGDDEETAVENGTCVFMLIQMLEYINIIIGNNENNGDVRSKLVMANWQ